MEAGVPTKRDLAVNGKDLIELGIEPGPFMGKLLREMEEMLLDHPEVNNKDYWLDYAKRRYEERNTQ